MRISNSYPISVNTYRTSSQLFEKGMQSLVVCRGHSSRQFTVMGLNAFKEEGVENVWRDITCSVICNF